MSRAVCAAVCSVLTTFVNIMNFPLTSKEKMSMRQEICDIFVQSMALLLNNCTSLGFIRGSVVAIVRLNLTVKMTNIITTNPCNKATSRSKISTCCQDERLPYHCGTKNSILVLGGMTQGYGLAHFCTNIANSLVA